MTYEPLSQKQVHVPSYPSAAWEEANMKVRSHERVVAWFFLSALGLAFVLLLVVLAR